MKPRCYAIRHVGFEDLGVLEDVLAERRFEVRYFQAGEKPLAACVDDEPELLVVLGGPIAAYEADAYPFIRDELNVVERRLAARRPLLGICLGAQLIAAAAGARVYPGPAREIGWDPPLRLTARGAASCLGPLSDCHYRVLHWHGDTFDLPPEAQLLASTQAVAHQAFSLGSDVLGLQFHAEVRPAAIERWLIGHAAELAREGIPPAPIRQPTRVHGALTAASARQVFTRWLRDSGLR